MTSAFCPVRSNMSSRPTTCAPTDRPAADRNAAQVALGAILLTRPREHPPDTDLDDLLDLLRRTAATLSRQRTMAVTCATSASLISSGSLVGAAVTLATTGTAAGGFAAAASASAMTSAAGAISGE